MKIASSMILQLGDLILITILNFQTFQHYDHKIIEKLNAGTLVFHILCT